MRKLFLLVSFILLFSSFSFANENARTTKFAVTYDSVGNSYSSMQVPSTTTNYTRSESLKNTGLGTNIGVMYKATSSGTISLSLQALRSFQLPTTEQSLDSTYVVWNVPTTISDSGWHMVTLDTVVEPYLVFRMTGTGSNDATTKLQINVEKL